MSQPPSGPVLFDDEEEGSKPGAERAGPVLFELAEDDAGPTPAEALPVPDGPPAPRGEAMQTLATLAARPPSRLAKLFWGALTGLIGVMISVAAWDFVWNLLQRNTILGYVVLVLV
ncbi:MAG: hypothetical protein AAFV38_00305, partial [Pseudomonadota bacterium]